MNSVVSESKIPMAFILRLVFSFDIARAAQKVDFSRIIIITCGCVSLRFSVFTLELSSPLHFKVWVYCFVWIVSVEKKTHKNNKIKKRQIAKAMPAQSQYCSNYLRQNKMTRDMSWKKRHKGQDDKDQSKQKKNCSLKLFCVNNAGSKSTQLWLKFTREINKKTCDFIIIFAILNKVDHKCLSRPLRISKTMSFFLTHSR